MTAPLITAPDALQLAFDAYASPRITAGTAPLQQQISVLAGQLAASQALLGQDDAALAAAKQTLAGLQTQLANETAAERADVATISAQQQQIAALQAQLSTAVPGKAPAPPAGYAVALQDDFNGTVSPVWTATTDAASNELSARLPGNVITGPDHLSIQAKRQASGTRLFTSGYITTAGKQSVPFGRWLIRARWTDLYGLWPALWLRFDGAPGEIDIMEAVGSWPHLAFTVHQNTSGQQDKSGTDWPWAAGWSPADWHVYGFERKTDGTGIWTVDGVATKTAHPTDLDNQHQPMNWLTGPNFTGPAHLICNLQVGGSMPSSVLPSFDQSKILPAGAVGSLELDWVQVLTPIAT